MAVDVRIVIIYIACILCIREKKKEIQYYTNINIKWRKKTAAEIFKKA